MPVVSTTLSTQSTGTTVEILHTELLNSGITIDSPEAGDGSFGSAMKSAVLAFQEKYGASPRAASIRLRGR